MIALPPSRCSTRMRSTPSPQATSRPSRPARNSVPGAASWCFVEREGAVHAHAFAGDQRLGHRPRVERAHLVGELRRRLGPVEPRLGLVELVRVGHALVRLRPRHRRACPRAAGPGRRRAPARRARRGGRAAGRRSRRRRSAATATAAPGRCRGPSPSASGTRRSRLSPASIARWIGAAPRQRGSSEACTFQQP